MNDSKKSMNKAAKYIVGIDLGTTNLAVAYIPVEHDASQQPSLFQIPQLVKVKDVQPRNTCASAVYLASEHEFDKAALTLPWPSDSSMMIGSAAKSRGAEVPGRLISSAKSWLCHHHLDREAAILPPDAAAEVPKYSPVDVSCLFLSYLQDAWNHTFADAPLQNQQILITVPASFDEAARQLTIKAAEKAGLAHVILLEEPQAALYAWLAQNQQNWREQLDAQDSILVCDVGGGTCDFSWVQVTSDQGELKLERVAVGEHLLLGGDNMDLALAHILHQKLTQQGKKLDQKQQRSLVLGAQWAKEQLLSKPELTSQSITLLGQGSRLFGKKAHIDLTREMVDNTVIEGFFPDCQLSDKPNQKRQSGFLQLGLPYATDAAITKHLANFLQAHIAELGHPTHILFNGGVFNAPVLKERLLDVLGSWGTKPKELSGSNNDLAVAKGAAYYGAVRNGQGIRIRGGAARSYWLAIEVPTPAIPGLTAPINALCIVPYGMQEGTEHTIEGHPLALVVGEAVEFRLLNSVTRKDPIGTVLEESTWTDHLSDTTPITATIEAQHLSTGQMVPVQLRVKLTELGQLELWCESLQDQHQYRVEFNLRKQEQQT